MGPKYKAAILGRSHALLHDECVRAVIKGGADHAPIGQRNLFPRYAEALSDSAQTESAKEQYSEENSSHGQHPGSRRVGPGPRQ
jgi:hypothetical protein